jgi:hypothetical protein
MMDRLVNLNVWIVFFALLIPIVAGSICADQLMKSLWYINYYVVFYGYHLFTFEICAEKNEPGNKVAFYFSTLFLLIFFGSLSIVLQPGTEVTITGTPGYLLAMIFAGSFSYNLYRVSGAQIAYTLGNKHRDTWNYFYHVICFMVLPLGIWILYPRLQEEYKRERLRNYQE